MRTMFDALDWTAIPSGSQLVAGYVDWPGVWPAAAWEHFAAAGCVLVRIASQASINDGQVLDVETGDATPQQAPGWVRMRRSFGVDPSVYMDFANWLAVRDAFGSTNTPEPHYWVAGYPGGGPVIPAGAVAHQYAAPGAGSPGAYDISVVADYWPGIDQAAPLPPTPYDDGADFLLLGDGL